MPCKQKSRYSGHVIYLGLVPALVFAFEKNLSKPWNDWHVILLAVGGALVLYGLSKELYTLYYSRLE